MVSPRLASRMTWLAALLAIAAPARADGPPLAHFVPSEGLVAYLEYDGLDAHEAAWKGSASYAMIHGTPAGAMIADVARQSIDRMLKEAPGVKITGADVVALHDHLFQKGFALALYGRGEEIDATVIVVRGLGRGEARARFDRALKSGLGDEAFVRLKPTKVRGRDVYRSANVPKPAPAVNSVPREALILGPQAPPRYLTEGAPAGVAPAPIAPAPAPAGASPALAGVAPAGVVPAPAAPAVIEPVPVAVAPAPMPAPAGPPAVAAKEGGDGTNPGEAWWFEGDDLVYLSGSGVGEPMKGDPAKGGPPAPAVDHVARVIDALEGKRPDASAHPGRLAALAEGKDVPGFEPDGLFFIESGGAIRAVLNDPRVPGIANLPVPVGVPGLELRERLLADAEGKRQALGIEQVARVVGRWGFHGKALWTDVRIEAPAPRKGMLALLDGPTFRKDKLPAIPEGAGAFAVGALDPARYLDMLTAFVKAQDADSAKEMDAALAAAEKAVREATGTRLREDLLAPLGPAWCAYAAPVGQGWKYGQAAPVVILGVRDVDAYARTLDELATKGSAALRALEGPGVDPKDPPALALEKLAAPARGFRLGSPSGLVPWVGEDLSPTVAVGEGSIVLAANPDHALAAVASGAGDGPRWTPDAETARAFEALPTDLALLVVGNPRDSSWPEALANLPAWAQYLGNLVVPGDEAAEPAAPGLALLGIPRAGGFRLRIEPAKRPKADDLRAHLFPSVLAATVDGRGLRIILREAVPLACFGADSNFKVNAGTGGMKEKLDVKIKLGPGG